MSSPRFFPLLAVALIAGCATPARTVLQRPTEPFPDEALIVQRGVLTARGKQFTLNGYLARSNDRGMRLIVTENFGTVLMDVLIKADGAIHVMRSGGIFRESWIRDYVAADVLCIFGDGPDPQCPGSMISPTHFLIQRRWYQLDLQIVETKPGEQPEKMFDETTAES